MRVAAVDVGTNSTRLLVAEAAPGGMRALERRLTITRLGEGVDRRRALAPQAVERTLHTISEYAAVAGEYGVTSMRVTGTSAVRDARNASEFIDAIRTLTGTEPEILTGESEARTTYLGVLSDLHDPGPVLVVDIGGGSTELIAGPGPPQGRVRAESRISRVGAHSTGPGGDVRVASLDIGCVRMFEKHLATDPPTPGELDALRAEVRAALDSTRRALSVDPGARLIGVAGTVTQLALLKSGLAAYDPEATHHSRLSHGDVRGMARRLASLPYEMRTRIKGLDPGRVDVIVAGAEILKCVMEAFDAAEILVSERDLLDGLALQLLS